MFSEYAQSFPLKLFFHFNHLGMGVHRSLRWRAHRNCTHRNVRWVMVLMCRKLMRLIIILGILRLSYFKWFKLLNWKCINCWFLDFQFLLFPFIFIFISFNILIGKLISMRHDTSSIVNNTIFVGVLTRHMKVCHPALSCFHIAIQSFVFVIHNCQVHILQNIPITLLLPFTTLFLLFSILIFPFFFLGRRVFFLLIC